MLFHIKAEYEHGNSEKIDPSIGDDKKSEEEIEETTKKKGRPPFRKKGK